VGCSHPGLDRAKGMLDRLAPLPHPLRMLIEPALDKFSDTFLHRLGHSRRLSDSD
jgi:hypothetical protein